MSPDKTKKLPSMYFLARLTMYVRMSLDSSVSAAAIEKAVKGFGAKWNTTTLVPQTLYAPATEQPVSAATYDRLLRLTRQLKNKYSMPLPT